MERRKRSRVVLELPLYYQALDSPSIDAALAVDGSEAGLLIHSIRDIPVGTQLRVEMLFADEFELSNIMAIVKVLRVSSSKNDYKGHGYGVSFLRIDKGNYRKLRRLLISRRHEMSDGAMDFRSDLPAYSASGPRRRCREKKRPFRDSFLHLLKTLAL